MESKVKGKEGKDKRGKGGKVQEEKQGEKRGG